MFLEKLKMMDFKKRVRIETLVLILLFISSLFMPFCDMFSLIIDNNGNAAHEKIDTMYVFHSPLIILCFLLLTISFLSFKRFVLSIINPIVIVLFVIFSFAILTMLNWSGSHRSPELRFGFWFSQSLIVISIIKGYIWRKNFNPSDENKRVFID